jgi:hypothetical protein
MLPRKPVAQQDGLPRRDTEIIAKASDDHTLIGGHHRLAVAASLGQKLFWKDTGEPVKLDPYFKGSSHRHTA